MPKKEDRRVKKTKAQLRKGLAHLMQTKSIKEITVTELVEEVDINRSTFYIHYRDIYHLLESIEAEIVEELMTAMEESPLNPMEAGKSYPFVTRLFHLLYEQKEICSALLGPNGDNSFVTKIEKLIEECSLRSLYEHYPKDIVDINYVYAFCITGCAGLVKSWLRSDAADTPEHMAELTYQLIADTTHAFIKEAINS